MCGIAGYIGNKEAYALLVEALKKIEYRGYDSAGICLTNGTLQVHKDKGKIDEVFRISEMKGTFGIAHTRWATHGGVSKENAHPHSDCTGKIMLVHNGVIENYNEIKEELNKKGHVFKSETDTEIIAHLLEDEMKMSKKKVPMQALESTLKKLKGSYALAIMVEGEDKIFFAKKDSPLLVGIGEGEMFLSSDVSAFLKFTKNYIALEDFDYGYITKERKAIFNLKTGIKAHRVAFTADFSEEETEKGMHEHFMLKEIKEQPAKVKDIFTSDVSGAKSLLHNAGKTGKVHLIGAGTSFHAALLLKYLLERNHGIESDCVISSEYNFYKKPNKNTLMIAYSQSGETADTLKAVKAGLENSAKLVSLTNIKGSSIDRLSDSTVYLNAGLEVGVAATKTFLAQLILSYRLSNDIENNAEEIEKLLQNSLKEEQEILEIVKLVKNKDHVFYLGRGLNYPLAMEGALKLKELSYIHAEAYPAGELKHGPLSLIDENSVAVFLVPKDETFSKTISNIQEVKARGAKIIAISDAKKEELGADYLVPIETPSKQELYPFAELIPMQLLAYYTAVALGKDTDKPRNLAKSVTVE